MDPLARLRASFVTGLLLVAPLAVTVFALDFAVDRPTGVLTGPVRATAWPSSSGANRSRRRSRR